MSYCLNLLCPQPQNSSDAEVCQCGAKLRLQGRYIALKLIGQGGFGRTFLAIDAAHPRKPRCVIKQFFPQKQNFTHLDKAVELFREEAIRLEKLGHHPQIPNLISYVEQEGHQYLIQEFIDGCNLAQELAEAGTFDEAKIYRLLLDLLPVVQFIHQHQLIHRDIKPANIIRRSSDSCLFLVDLGAAKQMTGTALAQTGTVIGSAEFTAPEQARGRAIFASDLYSLGATCIYLLTQISPFDLFDGGEGKWVWREYLRQPVDDRIGQILDKMLEPATNRRYQSAADVLTDLLAIRSPRPSEPRSTTDSSPHVSSPKPVKPPHLPDTQPPEQQETPDPWTRPVFEEMNRRLHVAWNLEPTSIQPSDSSPIANQDVKEKSIAPSRSTALRQSLVAVLILMAMLAPISLLTIWSAYRYNQQLTLSSLVPGFFKATARDMNWFEFKGVLSSIRMLQISEDGQTLVSSGVVGPTINWGIEAWNPNTGNLSRSFQPVSGEAFFLPLNWSQQLNGIIRQDKNTISLLDPVTGETIQTLKTDLTEPYVVQTSQDGKILAIVPNSSSTTDASPKIQLWNLQTRQLIRTFPGLSTEHGLPFFLSPDGSRVAITTPAPRNQSVAGAVWQIYSVQTGELMHTLESSGFPTQFVRFSPDNRTLLTLEAIAPKADRRITTSEFKLWSLDTGTIIQQIPLQQLGGDAAFSPIDDKIAIANAPASGSILVIDSLNGRVIIGLQANAEITKLAISPNARVLASANADNSIQLWAFDSGELIYSFDNVFSSQPNSISGLVFNPDGETIIASDREGTIIRLPIPEGRGRGTVRRLPIPGE